MNNKWMQLRTDWHNSAQDAFEGIVCQIAGAVESVPTESKFYRVKAPDAGVECYWVTPSGEEWGWQAKFFDSVRKSQWNQLTDSFRTAVEKQPQLVKYIVALPLDREDPRIQKQQWLMDCWNTWVRKRQTEAANQGRSVEIEFFGDYEIMAELSLEKHRGRRRFFFGIEDRLGPNWFKSHLKDITLLAGERYTPACHVELPIVEHFQSLGRTPAFLEKQSSLLLDTARNLNQAANATASTPVADRLQRPPDGIDGFSAILKFYIGSVNAVISNRIGIDEDRNLVREAVKLLAKEMAVSESRTVPLSKARSLIEGLHRVDRDENSLFAALIAEGVIAKDALPGFREKNVRSRY